MCSWGAGLGDSIFATGNSTSIVPTLCGPVYSGNPGTGLSRDKYEDAMVRAPQWCFLFFLDLLGCKMLLCFCLFDLNVELDEEAEAKLGLGLGVEGEEIDIAEETIGNSDEGERV